MGNRFAFRLLIALVAIATLAAVGFYAYKLGVAHGLAQSGHTLATPGARLVQKRPRVRSECVDVAAVFGHIDFVRK